MPIGAAIAVSGAAAAGGMVYGANKAAKSSKNALNAQQANLDKVWGSVNPFLTAGNDALGRISDPSKVLGNFQASPDYQFRLGQSLDAVTTSKAVNGLLRSGSALGAVTQRAGDLAAGEFGNWWNREKSVANMGLDANRIGAGLAGSSNENIGTNAANQGGAAIATGNAIGQIGGTIGELIARYGGGAGGGAGSSGSSYNPSTIANNPVINI